MQEPMTASRASASAQASAPAKSARGLKLWQTVPRTASSGNRRVMTRFDTTHWSVVLRARSGDATDARSALEALCRTYRPPVLAYIRGRGYPVEAAEDLAQAFFTRFLEH